MEEIGDLSKMKVAELKKQLKSRGLLVTGNKTELVERLQEAIEKDGSEGIDSNAGIDDSTAIDDEEFDEEEILGGDDAEEDIGKITPQEEAAALAGSISIKTKTSKVLTGKKKISLKRSAPSLDVSTEAPSVANDESLVEENDTSTNVIEEKDTSVVAEPKHKVIKLSEVASPVAEGALEARAKKFGIAAPNSEDTAKSARASRFGITESPAANNKTTKAPKLSMETGGTDVDKLKKRAERFGEVTSKSLSKLESIEKAKKRQERFGEVTKEATKEATKTEETVTDTTKTVKVANGTKPTKNAKGANIITAPSTEDSAKVKRAERFAV